LINEGHKQQAQAYFFCFCDVTSPFDVAGEFDRNAMAYQESRQHRSLLNVGRVNQYRGTAGHLPDGHYCLVPGHRQRQPSDPTLVTVTTTKCCSDHTLQKGLVNDGTAYRNITSAKHPRNPKQEQSASRPAPSGKVTAMSRFLNWLSAIGRHGPLLLCIGVTVGLFVPPLAAQARPAMGLAVFVFTLGAFLKVDRADFAREATRRWRLILILAWTIVGVPVLAFILTKLINLPRESEWGIILACLAPPVGSAAAIAAMLGLNAPLALIITTIATVATPIYIPLLVKLMIDAELTIDGLTMSVRLVAIVGGAALVSWLLKGFAKDTVERNPHAMTGISVIGLIVVAVGATHGIDKYIFAEPLWALELLSIAFAINVFFQIISALLFARLGQICSFTVGLLSGNRNVTLIWTASAPFVSAYPGVELFLAMSVFPIFMLPLLTKHVVRAINVAIAPPAILATERDQ